MPSLLKSAANPDSATAASDIYTLGVLLHELITLRRPQGPLNLALLGPKLGEVVRRCLESDPGQRYHRGVDLKLALRNAFALGQGESTQPVTDLHRRPPTQRSTTPPPISTTPPPADPQPRTDATPSGPIKAVSSVPPWHAPSGLHATPSQQLRIEELLSHPDDDPRECWLVRKGNLDFGPFAIADLRRRLLKEELAPDDTIIEQGTGKFQTIRQHPLTRDFVIKLEAHQATVAERQQIAAERRRRTAIIVGGVVVLGIVVIGAVVGLVFHFTRSPAQAQLAAGVPKQKAAEIGLSGIEFTMKADSPEQARQRLRSNRRRGRNGSRRRNSDLHSPTRLGDASQGGGDELLSRDAIQQVMQLHMRPLARCILEETRRTPNMSNVSIDFAVRGNGRVSAVEVNGKTSGRLHSCIDDRMRTIQFPEFDGSVTRASFGVDLRRKRH